MPDQAPLVSIVIPAREEELRLPPSIRAIKEAFPHQAWEFLIVVEPGRDRTAEAAREAAGQDARFCVIENPVPRGKGFAVKTGMLAARGDVVFFMDADLSVPLRCVGEFLAVMDGDPAGDVLIGSRRHPQSILPVRQPFLREASGRAFNKLLRLCGVTHLSDTQCGFKAFRRAAVKPIFSRVRQDGFGFDVEVVVLAEQMGFALRELPVEWSDVKGSKVKPLDGARAFLEAVLAARRIRRETPPHAIPRSQH